MTVLWRFAEPTDRPLLQAFQCTDPAPRDPGRRAQPHPKPWEKGVQSAIKQLPIPRTAGGADGSILLGLEGNDLVAVSFWSSDGTGQPPLIKMRLLAISSMKRGAGGNLARECVDETLRRIEAELPRDQDGIVYGLVDTSNRPSQAMLRDSGFEPQDSDEVADPDLVMWVQVVTGTGAGVSD